MDIFQADELGDWIRILVYRCSNRVQNSSWLFHSRREFQNFIVGCVHLGIAQAHRDEAKFDSERGSLFKFCEMKCFAVLRDELEREFRNRKLADEEFLGALKVLGEDDCDDVLEAQNLEELQDIFSYLSPDQRDILILVDYLGFPAKEAASILKRTVEAVYMLLKRAREAAAKYAREMESKGWVDTGQPKRKIRKARDELPDLSSSGNIGGRENLRSNQR